MRGRPIVLVSALGIFLSPNNWVEYSVTGAVEASGRDEDVVMCSNTDDGFQARTLGDWKIGIEAEGSGSGEHKAEFDVAAPRDVIPLTNAERSRGWRLEGSGTISIAEGGKDQFGLTVVTVEFAANGLTSPQEKTINLQGKLTCSAM